MYLSKEDKTIIVNFLKERLKLKFIYLFGSFAKGEGREDSDIDLAIYSDENVSGYDTFIIANDLAFEVKRDVQIINLKEASTVFAAQIVGTREVLYCKDKNFMENYNVRIFKDYVKLNEERQGILDSIKKDGKIYG